MESVFMGADPSLLIAGIDNTLLLTQFINGLVLGMIFVLVAIGLTVIFGLMGIINFAHGDLLLVGTYIAWALTIATGSILLGAVVATASVALVGGLIERLTIRPIYDRDPLLQLLLTFGIAEILRESVQVVWGPTDKSFPTPAWGAGSVEVLGITYPKYRLILLVITSIIIVGVYLGIYRTNLGLIVRAGTEDREMVNVLGINVKYIYSIVFICGSALAGLAGALIGPIRGAYPTLGIDLLIPAFVVVVVGGIGSLRGTVIAGLLVGQLMVFTGLAASSLSQLVIFVFMALVLIYRPAGLFGREGVFE